LIILIRVTRIGLVLGGGGARAAYEAGVLRYLARALPRDLGKAPSFHVVVGTSAGAINGAFVAASGGEFESEMDRLAQRWERLRIGEIYRFGLSRLWRLPLSLARSARAGLSEEVGLLDASPLHAMVRDELPWAGIRRAIHEGRLGAFAVTATELATSRTVLWVEGLPEDHPALASNHPYIRPRSVVLGPDHVLASSAIPLVFPPVPVEGRFYVDGGLGQPPLFTPAVRLGADRVLGISLRKGMTVAEGDLVAEERGAEPPGWGLVVGKTLNAILLDRAEYEMHRIEGVNQLLRWGRETFGPAFQDELGRFMDGQGGVAYKEVKTLTLSPSKDLGVMASAFAGVQELHDLDSVLRRLLRYLGREGAAAENDALSYLLFEPGFARALVALGEADAEARHDELVEFFADS